MQEMRGSTASAGRETGRVIPLHRPEQAPAGEAPPQTPADWRAFYDANWPWIFGLIRRMGGGDIDVEDAVQDVFLVLASKLDTFEGRSQLRTWVYRICLNVTSEHRRRRMRRRRLDQALDLVQFWSAPQADAHDLLQARTELAVVHRVLAKMSEKKREVFVLREMEELSGDEVAEILAIPPATVRTRLFHARREFVRLLQKTEGSESEL